MLVSATFDDNLGYLVLTFDQAIDASAMEPATCTIVDANQAETFAGYGFPEAVGDDAVRVTFSGSGPYEGEGVLLTATSANGIVAQVGGLPWDGVDSLPLPFP